MWDGNGGLSLFHVGDDQTLFYYGGNGKEAKETHQIWSTDHWVNGDSTYFIYSTVLGQNVSKVGTTGKKVETYILNRSGRIATQSEWVYSGTTYQSVTFEHRDPSGMSLRDTSSSGTIVASGANYDGAPIENDPMGANVGLSTPYISNPPDTPPADSTSPYLTVNDFFGTPVSGSSIPPCSVDGLTIISGCGSSFA